MKHQAAFLENYANL